MVSLGGGGGASKQKSKSEQQSQSHQESRTAFTPEFFSDAYKFFGCDPGYKPEYVGFDSFHELERNAYDTAKNRATEGYRGALNLQNEELSNMGLLNSPSKFIEGGSRDTLNKNYLNTLQQAARDANTMRYGLQREEAGRQTEFNVNNANALLTKFLQMLQLAGSAGRYSVGDATSSGSSSGSGSSWNANLNMGFGS